MADGMHLGDEVEIVTDNFAPVGAPRGSIGVIVDDWADGSNDIEVSDSKTGEVIARFRAAEDEVREYSGPIAIKEPRKHGILFGRGDDLGAPVGDPPAAIPDQFGGLPGRNSTLSPVGDIPPEGATPADDVPWELRDEPPTEPVFN